ncbi:MAG: J domain-containing protein [Xanthobacteraceae bacterium]
MLQAGGSGEVSIALANAVLLALWAVLPGLLFGYLWQSRAARRIGATFALRKSEAAEIDRALAAYAKVCRRIENIGEQPRGIRGFWRELLGRSDSGDDERDDLQAHAEHLRASIGRLRRRPLQRLKTWIHVRSTQFALGQALAVHIVGLTLMLLAAFRVSGVSAWAAEFSTAADNALVWYPCDARLFYANAAATAFAAAAAPLFYIARCAVLRRERQVEFCVFKDLANTDPYRSAEATEPCASAQYEPPAGHRTEVCDWPAVLGLSRDATIEEVKEAYKTLIKQNHPDRVQGMSMAFLRLAETETKKINAAYRQALAAARRNPLHGMADSDTAA